MTTGFLYDRNCWLDPDTHKYFWDPKGVREMMAVSVTGVINHDKPPYDGPPEAGWRGTHVHRSMEAMAIWAIENSHPSSKDNPPESWDVFMDEHGMISPEGIDCAAWIEQLQQMEFWKHIEVLACEYTMVHRRKSLGGQLDLLCKYKSPKSDQTKTMLVDLKTKGASWTGPSGKDVASYRAQAGGYLTLLDSGDEAHGGCWVDTCMTLVVTPRIVKWLPPMTPQSCLDAWFDCWERYALAGEMNPF